jgi:hypothetical protein
MSKEQTTDNEADWEPVEADTAGLSALLTIRFTQAEIRQIRDAAKNRGVSMADIVRQAVRSQSGSAPPVRIMGWTKNSNTNVLADSRQVTLGSGLQHEAPAAEEAA